MITKDFLGNEWEVDCMACAINKGSISVPGDFIKRTQYFFVDQDPLIPLPGFLVIASTRHIQSISEMNDMEYDELSKLIKDTHRAIKDVTNIEYLTIIQEERSIHFHLWFFPWTRNVIERHGKPSLSKIREIMAEFSARSIDDLEWKELETTIEKIKTQMSP